MGRLEIAERAYRLAAGSGHTGMEVWGWDWLWMWLGWGGMLVFGFISRWVQVVGRCMR